MIALRHFTPEDAESIHSFLYPDLSMSEIADMIQAWNACVYQGKYFEMFAVVKDGGIVGSASLREQSEGVVSAGIRIFQAERKKGFASQAMAILIAFAAQKGFRIMMDQVGTDNQASILLHEKLGFFSDRYAYQNQRNHAVFLFIKPL